MRQIGDFLGGLLMLFVLGAICYGGLKDGNFLPIIIVGGLFAILFVFGSIEEKNNKMKWEKEAAKAKAIEEEKKRIQKIESMTESEFIAFVKYNYGKYDRHFKIEGVGGKHGVETKVWSTSKYKILSEVDTNEFNDFITVFRKTDGKEIFSGCWGSGYD